MNHLLTFLAASAFAAPAVAQVAADPSQNCLHISTSFDLTVHASYTETIPLFGPEGERAWAGKHWNPQFVYPRPAKDVEGAVFVVQHGPFHAAWVNTAFDIEGRHLQYVYFMADLMVTVIDVRFKPISPNSTAVHVTYTRTALTLAGNEHVIAMSEGDKSAGKEWQQGIDAYLDSRTPTHEP